MKKIFTICILLLSFSLAFANHSVLRNDPFNTTSGSAGPGATPDSALSSFRTNSRIFWDHEDAQREGEFFRHFIYSGGIHATASGFTSATFATIAHLPERVSQTSTAITYAAIANDVCWTIISSDNNGIVGWMRVGTTSYYFQCEGDTTPNQPVLPPNSAWLMQVTITASNIATVLDLRTPASLVYAGRYDVTDNLFAADPTGVTDSSSAIQAAINAARGRIVYVPKGVYRVNTMLTDIRDCFTVEVGTCHSQGLTLEGDGSFHTFFDTRVANNPMIKIQGSANNKFQVRGTLKGFSIITNSAPTAGIGIQIKANWQLNLDDIRIAGMLSDGIRISFDSADADGPVMVRIERSWVADNVGMGLNVITPPGVGVVENSFLEIDRSFFFLNDLGGVNVRGLIFTMTNSASSINGGFGGLRFHFAGASSGNNRLAYVRNNEFGHNNGYGIEIQSLSSGVFIGNECVNTTIAYSAPLGCVLIGGTADTNATDVEFDHHHVRVDSSYTPFIAYDIRAESQRLNIHDTRYALFDAAGQDRYLDLGLQTRICDANTSGFLYCYPVGQNTTTATLTTSGDTYTPNANVYAFHKITLTGVGNYTILNPTISAQHEGQFLVFDILNSAGGIVAVGFGNTYMVGSKLIRTPNGEHSSLIFIRNGAGWSLLGEQNSGYYEAEDTVTPGVIAANACYQANIVVAGAVVGDKVIYGVDASIIQANTFLTSSADVYIPGAVAVRICNVSVGASSSLPAGIIKVRVVK